MHAAGGLKTPIADIHSGSKDDHPLCTAVIRTAVAPVSTSGPWSTSNARMDETCREKKHECLRDHVPGFQATAISVESGRLERQSEESARVCEYARPCVGNCGGHCRDDREIGERREESCPPAAEMPGHPSLLRLAMDHVCHGFAVDRQHRSSST